MAELAKLVGDADLPIGRFSNENPIRTVSISGRSVNAVNLKDVLGQIEPNR